jgi:hypothetical protein
MSEFKMPERFGSLSVLWNGFGSFVVSSILNLIAFASLSLSLDRFLNMLGSIPVSSSTGIEVYIVSFLENKTETLDML